MAIGTSASGGNFVKEISVETISRYMSECGEPKQRRSRHNKTQLGVKTEIARLIKKHAAGATNLLEIGGYTGWQTMLYRDCMSQSGNAQIYDWQDYRSPTVRQQIGFRRVDLETERFPAQSGTFDVIVINQVLEHLKNIFLPLTEICRVLKVGGHLAVSVPNICALHNLVLLMAGRQPTTTELAESHIRGFAIWSLSQFLQHNGHLKVLQLRGFGLHPFTSAPLPGLLKTYCHTPVWFLLRTASTMPTWQDEREAQFTTT
jgi:SAM-dependent methyltransferase